MKSAILNTKGEKTGDLIVPSAIFDAPYKADLVHQVAVILQGNKRQVSAHAKGRGEVRGGGKKPWRQKGTGRARHGSIRSPLWAGGGVTHGPKKERNYKGRINEKMHKGAMRSLLSEKLRAKHLMFVDSLSLEKGKTKELHEIMTILNPKGSRVLLVLAGNDQKIIRASRNIPGIVAKQASEVGVLDFLNAKDAILPKDAIRVLEKRLSQ